MLSYLILCQIFRLLSDGIPATFQGISKEKLWKTKQEMSQINDMFNVMEEFYAQFTILDWILYPFKLLIVLFEAGLTYGNRYWIPFVWVFIFYVAIIYGIKSLITKLRKKYSK